MQHEAMDLYIHVHQVFLKKRTSHYPKVSDPQDDVMSMFNGKPLASGPQLQKLRFRLHPGTSFGGIILGPARSSSSGPDNSRYMKHVHMVGGNTGGMYRINCQRINHSSNTLLLKVLGLRPSRLFMPIFMMLMRLRTLPLALANPPSLLCGSLAIIRLFALS